MGRSTGTLGTTDCGRPRCLFSDGTEMHQQVLRAAFVAGLSAAVTGCGRSLPASLTPPRRRDQGILYVRMDGYRRKLNIYRMNADGSRSGKLTRTNALEFDPAWSPDRRQIAFAAMNDLR